MENLGPPVTAVVGGSATGAPQTIVLAADAPTKPTTELVTTGLAPDPIQIADEQSARVAWVQEKIAASFFEPLRPPEPWAGRDSVVESAAQKFKIELADARGLVDLAVQEIWVDDREDSTDVKRHIHLLRLKDLARLINQQIRNGGRREVTTKYHFVQVPNDPMRMMKQPTGESKEKVYEGVEPAWVTLLMQCYAQIADLEGMKKTDGSGDNLLNRIFAQLDKKRLEGKKAQAPGSKAHAVLVGEIDDSCPQATLRLGVAVAEMNAPKSKPVESKVTDGGDDDEDEGGVN